MKHRNLKITTLFGTFFSFLLLSLWSLAAETITWKGALYKYFTLEPKLLIGVLLLLWFFTVVIRDRYSAQVPNIYKQLAVICYILTPAMVVALGVLWATDVETIVRWSASTLKINWFFLEDTLQTIAVLGIIMGIGGRKYVNFFMVSNKYLQAYLKIRSSAYKYMLKRIYKIFWMVFFLIFVVREGKFDFFSLVMGLIFATVMSIVVKSMHSSESGGKSHEKV